MKFLYVYCLYPSYSKACKCYVLHTASSPPVLRRSTFALSLCGSGMQGLIPAVMCQHVLETSSLGLLCACVDVCCYNIFEHKKREKEQMDIIPFGTTGYRHP
jgi:hypothetical protein